MSDFKLILVDPKKALCNVVQEYLTGLLNVEIANNNRKSDQFGDFERGS